ncbi:hypothetical protein GUITHDRAFT_136311 [Guillardia theta CCMP2712]|uniref:Uncharacterized protein n=1 Tax=Guillardia theta (strain CCMP2712) TaxID=905079 RepID=L1JKW7_GUITC|nr:hypothetical protein GUITHDRAFT_136311 [Guillardia theta CCMP2712]EKX49148.1 hypothetical protein GUITHDRAFT_136311 [Guillardia theta CCMP2712]|eukprot:XP_005836128.1 hypothetical protein GUITHDRAFT_136311 [Guillardia theta CCMP2712]
MSSQWNFRTCSVLLLLLLLLDRSMNHAIEVTNFIVERFDAPNESLLVLSYSIESRRAELPRCGGLRLSFHGISSLLFANMTRVRLFDSENAICDDCELVVPRTSLTCVKYARLTSQHWREQVRYVEAHVMQGATAASIGTSQLIEGEWCVSSSQPYACAPDIFPSIHGSIEELAAARQQQRLLTSMHKGRGQGWGRGQVEQQTFMLWWLPVEDYLVFQPDRSRARRLTLFSPLQHSVHGSSSLELAYQVDDPPPRFLVQVLLQDTEVLSSRQAYHAETLKGIPAGEHLLRLRLIVFEAQEGAESTVIDLDESLYEEVTVDLKIISDRLLLHLLSSCKNVVFSSTSSQALLRFLPLRQEADEEVCFLISYIFLRELQDQDAAPLLRLEELKEEGRGGSLALSSGEVSRGCVLVPPLESSSDRLLHATLLDAQGEPVEGSTFILHLSYPEALRRKLQDRLGHVGCYRQLRRWRPARPALHPLEEEARVEGFLIRWVDPIRSKLPQLDSRNELELGYSKLHLWQLVEYQRVFYVDADSLVSCGPADCPAVDLKALPSSSAAQTSSSTALKAFLLAPPPPLRPTVTCDSLALAALLTRQLQSNSMTI